MDIVANHKMEVKEPWWKVLMSFGSISRNEVEENEISEIEKQQDSKYIRQLEKNISEIVVEKTKKRNSKTVNEVDMESKKIKRRADVVNDRDNNVLKNEENEHVIE